MGSINDIINTIKVASPKELSDFMDALNRETFLENSWNFVAVKASYAELVRAIEYECATMEVAKEAEMSQMSFEDCDGEIYTYSVVQAWANLSFAWTFLNEPPVGDNPANEIKISTLR